jgi:hypothetical protein
MSEMSGQMASRGNKGEGAVDGAAADMTTASGAAEGGEKAKKLSREEKDALRKAICAAITVNDAEETRRLIKAGANVRSREDGQFTLLMQACIRHGSAEVVRALLSVSDVREVDAKSRGLTALHVAAQAADGETVAALLLAGADPAATTVEGWTPLHIAARADNAETFAALWPRSDRQAKDKKRQTAEKIAKTPGSINVLRFLEHERAREAAAKERDALAAHADGAMASARSRGGKPQEGAEADSPAQPPSRRPLAL